MGIVGPKSKTIDGVTYTTRTLNAFEGIVMGARLARLADVDSITALLTVDLDELADGGALGSNPELVLNVLMGAARSLSPEELATLARDLFRYTEADKVKIGESEVPASVFEHFETHFAGRLTHMLEVAAWVAQASFDGP